MRGCGRVRDLCWGWQRLLSVFQFVPYLELGIEQVHRWLQAPGAKLLD